ncbi:MAG: hypothetical protein NVSMB55_18620 [Mycobacteriales bacterium]
MCLPADMTITAQVAALARSPFSFSPDPPPELGARRVVTSRYCAFLTPMPTLTFVENLTFPVAEAQQVQREVRALLHDAGRSQAAWVVSSNDPDLHDALVGLGMTPYVDPPLGPHSTAMALTSQPAWPESPGIHVREAVELSDFLAVAEMTVENFGVHGADAQAMRQAHRVRWELLEQGRARMRTFLAYFEDRLVGQGQCSDAEGGTNLGGSSVAPQARGKGAYRALVAARWQHAVARGVPALTVQAGAMSRPVLERLGFTVIDRQWVLCDRDI